MNNVTMRDDQIQPLLKSLLSILKLKVTRFSLLRQINRHLSAEKNIFLALCKILNEWGIDARFIPLGFEMFWEIPIPSLIFLYDHQFNQRQGRIVMLIEADKDGAKFLEAQGDFFHLSHAEIKSRWSDIVIALDAEDAMDEKGYDDKVIAHQEAIRRAAGVTVIMPVYNQASFISRALASLQMQTFKNWELILVDDGSVDDLLKNLSPFLADERFRYFRNNENMGLGFCLNKGLENASFEMIAYLPADDIYFKDHLRVLVETLLATNASMVFSGVLHHSNDQFDGNYGAKSVGIVDGYPLQLVQVLHAKTKDRWIERDELVTDDLNKMFWNKFLRLRSGVLGTREVSCEWVDHPYQRHKIINDRKGGGIYAYKQYYRIKQPIRFQSSVGNYIDEVDYYKSFRSQSKSKPEGLKILLVGELAYNPERIVALEERGHKLYGIWITRPANYNTVGPLPFGHVEDITCEQIAVVKPDVIYALLNYQAVSLAHKIMTENPNTAFVWHFKESPSHCLQNGTWPLLIDLYRKCDGRMYTNSNLRDWFEQILPDNTSLSFVLDGELPKKEWFRDERSGLLSHKDGEIHTVFVGRPIGIFPEDVQDLAEQKIHLHFYGDIFHVAYKDFLAEAIKIAPRFIHTHKNCTQENWVKEFSQYDAGWLHIFKSQNFRELSRANWLDLNNPARISTYAMSGVPMLQRDNSDHIVAAQAITDQFGMGIVFKSFREIGEKLYNQDAMSRLRTNVWNNRFHFCFDSHVDDLISFFRKVIHQKSR